MAPAAQQQQTTRSRKRDSSNLHQEQVPWFTASPTTKGRIGVSTAMDEAEEAFKKRKMGATTIVPATATVDGILPSVHGVVHDIDKHLDQTIRVKVGRGPESQEFDLHRGILKVYSGYFRAAIENIEAGNFTESASGVIELPDEDASVFASFKRWLYAADHKLSPNGVLDYAMTYVALCELWCFAERRIIPMLQNRALDIIITKCSDRQPMILETIRYAYEESGPGSHLRRLIVHYHSQGRYIDKGGELGETAKEEWFREWAADVAVERMTGTLVSLTQSMAIKRCDYHVHEVGVQCYENARL